MTKCFSIEYKYNYISKIRSNLYLFKFKYKTHCSQHISSTDVRIHINIHIKTLNLKNILISEKNTLKKWSPPKKMTVTRLSLKEKKTNQLSIKTTTFYFSFKF